MHLHAVAQWVLRLCDVTKVHATTARSCTVYLYFYSYFIAISFKIDVLEVGKSA